MNVTGFSIKDPPFEENFQQSDCYSYKGLCPVSVRWDSEKCLVNLICIWKISHEREYVHIYLTKSFKKYRFEYMEYLFLYFLLLFNSINQRLWWTPWSSWVTQSTRQGPTITPPCSLQTATAVTCQNNTEILDENSWML